MSSLTLRCAKRYEVKGHVERCVKDDGHGGDCQLTLWWSVKVPLLEIGIGTGIKPISFTVRRVE